ncbi:MAG: peptide chain release factor N(5)-glutamine methyltransferase [bacterium]|nr:peptide chain release factor N(5)-glutamine methyltransferase [bacterium]
MAKPDFFPKLIAEKATVLESAGIESAKAEMEWILCFVLEVDRLNLYLHGAELLNDAALARVEKIVTRRATRYPLQYILEESWFYGRKFLVSPAVMVPTPETEGLCEAALGFVRSHEIRAPRILDVGTGSGVIAVTMASELDRVDVVAVDKSTEALDVAMKNASDLEVSRKIDFRPSDFFAALEPDERFDLVLSNPPYIRDVDYADLPPEVKADPRLAMTSGKDGLDAVRVILRDAPKFLAGGGRIMFEIGMGQSEEIAALTADDARYRSFSCLKDLNDIDRIVILSCRE